MSKMPIDEVFECLINHVVAGLGDPKIHVGGVTSEALNEEQELIAPPPAVFLQFQRETATEGRDRLGLDYDSMQEFLVVAGDRNLAGIDAERTGTLKLISRLRDLLAGARLTLPSGGYKLTVKYRGAEIYPFVAAENVGTFYALMISVEGRAQFTANAAAA